MVVQVNGKVRGRVTVPADASDEDVLAAATTHEGVARYLEGKTLVKQLVVRGRLVVLVAK